MKLEDMPTVELNDGSILGKPIEPGRNLEVIDRLFYTGLSSGILTNIGGLFIDNRLRLYSHVILLGTALVSIFYLGKGANNFQEEEYN
jgi:hypothetical protein